MNVDWIRALEKLRTTLQQPISINVEQIIGGGQPLTRVNDTNVTLTLGGTPATALLKAVSLTLGWTGVLGLSRGGTAAALTAINGGLVYSGAAALAITSAGTSGQIIKSAGAAAPTWNTPAALTKVDDTNVTLTLGGSPSTALVNAASLTLGWTGQLGVTRGGTGLAAVATGDLLYGSAANVLSRRAIGSTGDVLTVTGGLPVWAATSGLGTGDLTRVDDTNVTLTLGGTPVDSLFKDVSLTLGWTGTLAATRGGTGTGTYAVGDILYASTTSALSRRAIGSTSDVLTVTGGVPVWAAPAASGTSVIVDDTTTNATMFPTWVTASSGSLPLKVTSSKLTFNPATGLLSTTTLTTTGLITTGGGILINGGSFASGKIYKDATFGLALAGITGSTSDITFITPSGGSAFFTNPTGTSHCYLAADTVNAIANGRLGIGTNIGGMPSTGTNCIVILDGTAPTSPASNTALLYADDVNGTVQLFSMNEAGLIDRLTDALWNDPITPATDQTIKANCTSVVDGSYTIASGRALNIGLGGSLRIL
jgi:hypothetical protein